MLIPRRIRLRHLPMLLGLLEDPLRLVQRLQLELKLLYHLKILCLHHLKLSALEPVCKVV
jgi:hypothetical protein